MGAIVASVLTWMKASRTCLFLLHGSVWIWNSLYIILSCLIIGKHPDGVPHRWIRTPYTQHYALFIAILCIYIPFLHVSSFIYRYFFAFSKLQLGCGLSDIIKVIFDFIWFNLNGEDFQISSSSLIIYFGLISLKWCLHMQSPRPEGAP